MAGRRHVSRQRPASQREHRRRRPEERQLRRGASSPGRAGRSARPGRAETASGRATARRCAGERHREDGRRRPRRRAPASSCSMTNGTGDATGILPRVAAPPPRRRKERHQRERGERSDEAADRGRRRRRAPRGRAGRRAASTITAPVAADHPRNGREQRRSRRAARAAARWRAGGADERQRGDRGHAAPKRPAAPPCSCVDRELDLEQRRAVRAGDRKRLRRGAGPRRRRRARPASPRPGRTTSQLPDGRRRRATVAGASTRLGGGDADARAVDLDRLDRRRGGGRRYPCATNSARGPESRSARSGLRPGRRSTRALRYAPRGPAGT